MFVGVVQLLSHVQLFATPWTASRQAPLSSTLSVHIYIYPLLLWPPSHQAISFYFVQNSVSEIWFGIGVQKGWAFSIKRRGRGTPGLQTRRARLLETVLATRQLKAMWANTIMLEPSAASWIAQLVKNLPAKWEVQLLDWEDSLEKG